MTRVCQAQPKLLLIDNDGGGGANASPSSDGGIVMFVVVALAANLEYRYRSRKAALARFERLVLDYKASTVSVVHSTRRIDEVIAFWSRDPAPTPRGPANK